MEIEGDFIDDKYDNKNGFIKEYKNGKLFSETQYLEGVPLRAKHYNEKGNVIMEYAEKWIKQYYDNGNLKIEGDYYAGFNGIMKKYYENGKLLFEGEAKENEWWNGKEYDENGEIIYEIKDGKSLKKKKDEDGEEIKEDKEDEEEEEEKKEEEEKTKEKETKNKNVFEGEYYEGKYWTGKLKEYYENGNIKGEIDYLNGEKNGNCKVYDDDGKIKTEVEYINGYSIKTKSYKKGILIVETEHLIVGEMEKMIVYHQDNGAIKYEGNDYRWFEGTGKLYNKKGELLFEGEFVNNKYWNGK